MIFEDLTRCRAALTLPEAAARHGPTLAYAFPGSDAVGICGGTCAD